MNWSSTLKHWALFPFGPSPGACIQCAAWLGPGLSTCDRCVNFLNEIHGRPHAFAHPLRKNIRCRSLLEWVPGASDQLSQNLLALKGHGSWRTWWLWAGRFLDAHASGLFRQDVEYVFWAVPAARPQRLHARDFAVALAALSGGRLVDQSFIIMRQPEGATIPPAVNLGQKSRRRKDRLAWLAAAPTSVNLTNPMGGDESRSAGAVAQRHQQLVIVDDILTTGATTLWWARQLSADVPVEVWTLAHRSRLAP